MYLLWWPSGKVSTARAFAVAFLILVTTLFWFLLFDLVWAHDNYPSECCDDQDCRPVPCAEFSEEVRWSGHGTSIEIVVLNSHGKQYFGKKSNVRPSPDGQCHACFWPGTFEMRCIFWPMKIS